MRKFLLLIALMVSGFGIVSAQNEITIGNGTSSDYNAPFNNYYKHSWNETIYQKGDIGGAGTITSVSYQRASASSYTTQTIKIYMGETTRSSISSTTDWTPANQLTLVYSGNNITIGDSAWETFTLNTPFEYSGENNLVVVVAKTASSYTNSLKWYYTNSSNGSNVTMYRQNDSSTSYASHPSGNSGTRLAYAANIKLGIKSMPQPLTYGDTKYINYGTATLKYTVTSINPAECKVICTTEPTTETAITIPSKVLIKGNQVSVTKISYRDNSTGAFDGCYYLTRIEIPSTVTQIDNYAFRGCSRLADVYIHDGSTTLELGYNYLSDEDYANDKGLFDDCPLKNVYLGRNLIYRESTYGSDISPFRYKNIPSLTISNSVTKLNNKLFDGVSIEKLYINDFSAWCNIDFYNRNSNPMMCAKNIYINNSLVKNLTIPANVTQISDHAIVGYKFNTLSVAANNPIYDSRNNCNAIIETATNTLIYGSNSSIIPSGIVSIGSYAFFACSSLTSIEIPSSVTYIGSYSFENCNNLTSITCHAKEVPNTEYRSFYNCPSNMVIKVPAKSVSLYQAASPWNNYTIEALPPQIAIGDNTTIAYNGYSLKYTVTSVEPAECEVTKCILTNVTSITIPSTVEINGEDCSVTSIGQESFYYISNVKIPSITIPNTVKSIARKAFAGCKVDNIIIEENSQLTTIGYEAFDFCWMTSFEVPKSVTSIGDRAFCSCESMSTLTFEENSQLTSIGSYAFQACCGLTSIEIPSSVTSIGKAIISSLSPNNMTTVIVAEGNTKYDSRNNCNAIIETATNTLIQGCKNTIIPNTVTSIGEYAFYDLDGEFTSIEIPSSITSIGDKAFSQSTYLANITCLAESVPQTSEDAFEGCPSKMKIYVPKSSVSLYQAASPWNNYTIEAIIHPIAVGDETVIDYEGYSLKYILTSVEPAECEVVCSKKPEVKTMIEIPSMVEINENDVVVTSIGENAFSECSYLTEIDIPNTITSIGNKSFWKSGLENIVFPNSVTSIGKLVINNCNEIKIVMIPSSLVEIGDNNFISCPKLKTLVIDSNNPIYDSRNNCNALIETSTNTLLKGCKNTIIPNSVTSIASTAFYGCTSLTNIEIPNSITSIGSSAFYECTSLNNIEIPNSVTSLGYAAFDGCSSLNNIVIPNSITSLGYAVFRGCISLMNIELSSNLVSIGNNAFYGCTSLNNIEIPNNVTSIGSSAFDGCTSLKNVIFEENSSLSSIGEYAFARCSSMTEVIIPGSVISIGKCVFDYCSSLKSITFEENSQFTSIGDNVFGNCQSLKIIEFPSGITSIGNSNFWYCTSLETIVCYAENVPELGYNMFFGGSDYMIIYVPASSVEEYEDSQWSSCGHIEAITEYDICGDYLEWMRGPYSEGEYSQQIYTSEDIFNDYFYSDCITSISLMPSSDVATTRKLKIYMKNVTKSEFEHNSDWIPVSDSDLVYDGELYIDAEANSWLEIEFERAFLYTGDNILLCIYDYTNESWDTDPYFLGYITTNWDTGMPDKNYSIHAPRYMLGGDDISTVSGDLRNERNYIRLGFGSLKPEAPTNLQASVVSDYKGIFLSWSIVGDADSYNVYKDGVLIDNVSWEWFDDGTNSIYYNLDNDIEYCFTVTAVCGFKESAESESLCITITNPNLRTFIGNGNWTLASNWKNSTIPTSTNEVLVKGSAVITDKVTVKSIDVDNNGSLTIKDGGQLVCNDVTGNITVEKEIEGYADQDGNSWYTIASPLKGETSISSVTGLITSSSDYDLYRYDEPTYTWQNYKNSASNGFTKLKAGRGYLYANSDDVTLSYTGNINTDNVSYSLTKDGDVFDGFHLIANPFTHNINFAHLSAKNGASLANGYYVLSGDGAWGAILGNNAEDVIKVGQGALIKAENAGTLFIRREPQSSRSQQSIANSQQLKLTVANGKYSDKAFIVFAKGAGLDKINHQNENIPMLYIPVDGVDYAIATIDKNFNEIPVNFETNVMGEYTISLRQENCEFEELYLLDKETNTTVNILAEDYTFIATSSDNPERFVLIKDNGQQPTDNSHFAYVNNGDIVIYDIEGNGDIQIFDAMGRCVYNGNCCTDAIHRIPMGGFSTGVYMIQKADESGVKVQKIIL